MRKQHFAAIALLVAIAPMSGAAVATTTGVGDTATTTERDDKDFPWGLLGLAGLAGLLGRNRNDRDDRVNRNTTGTNTRP